MGGIRRTSRRFAVATAIVAAVFLTASATAGTGALPSAAKPVIDPPFETQYSGSLVVDSVAELGDGFVAVGYEQDRSGHRHSVVWTEAAAGDAWTRVDDEAFDDGNRIGPNDQSESSETAMHAVAVGSDGIVAGGDYQFKSHADDENAVATTILPAAWFSSDGSSWTRSQLSPPDGTTTAQVISVTQRDGRYVAVGIAGESELGTSADRPAAWYSDDGTTWTNAPSITDSVSQRGNASSVTASGSGVSPQYLAVGSAIDEDGKGQSGAVWTSEDGTTWEKAPEQAALGKTSPLNQSIRAVVAVGEDGEFKAVGDERKNKANTPSQVVLWESRDGTTWTRSKTTPAAFAPTSKSLPSTAPFTVAVGPGYYVVGGYQSRSDDSGAQARGWYSTDFRHWTRLSFTDGSGKVGGGIFGSDTNDKNYLFVGRLGVNGNTWDGDVTPS